MSFLTWFLGGLSGVTGVSSMAAFLVHLLSGNADMALQYFMVLGLSVALAWIPVSVGPPGLSIFTVARSWSYCARAIVWLYEKRAFTFSTTSMSKSRLGSRWL